MGPKYRLGINMAGAISAGAYTAGVLDYFIEALDAWEAAKKSSQLVPRHDVSIDILTGASAGGMCTALGAVSMFDPPNPCPGSGRPWAQPTRLYRAWVQEIRMQDLTSTSDLDAMGPEDRLTSLLNSSALHSIADSTLNAPAAPHRRAGVSEKLRLLLTLTNLRGIPYSVNRSNLGTFFERTDYYADQIQFSFDSAEAAADPTISGFIDVNDPQSKTWPLVRTAAIASGAVPLMLAPQVITRTPEDYEHRQWAVPVDPNEHPCVPGQPCVCEERTAVPPAWDEPDGAFEVLYADGGATNNNPFECARRYIAGLNGLTHNERRPMEADASVLTIAPFPGDDGFDPNWQARKNAGLLQAILALKEALTCQSRFLGESLTLLGNSDVASRYVIVPKDDTVPPGMSPLQSASLGAFGGFFSEEFRRHDYHLGRYNCQRFLQQWFVLPVENPLIAAGVAGPHRAELIRVFKADPMPGGKQRSQLQTEAWMPILPVCGAAAPELTDPPIVKMTPAQLETIIDRALERVKALIKLSVKEYVPKLSIFAGLIASLAAHNVEAKLHDAIVADLKKHRCY